MSGITTLETNIRTYVGVEQESVSLIHWPSDASPLLNVACKDPNCVDVDAALMQVSITVVTEACPRLLVHSHVCVLLPILASCPLQEENSFPVIASQLMISN